MTSLIIFFILNFINVVLGTMRSVLTVKASPLVATLINTISYTFYAGIVKLTTGQSLLVVVLTTFITNVIGVYLAKNILTKFEKDRLWVIEVTADKKDLYDICTRLNCFNIGFTYNYLNNKDLVSIHIYSYTQRESLQTKKVLQPFNVKYNITESKGLL